MTKVSVIVPVYNVEKFLPKCLDSLVNQTFKEYEIIIVNDGSPDNSQDIINLYKEKHPKLIRSFIKKNGGLSDARNYGIDKARGEYIMFIDSDDYVTSDIVEKLYNCIEKEQSDIAVCNFIRINSKGKEIKNYNYNPGTVNILNNKQILFNQPTACNKIYKRELFKDLRFDKGKYYEDLRLINKLYLKCNKVAFIDDFCYYYVERANSIMQDTNIKRNIDIIDAVKSIIDFYKDEKKYDAFKDEIEFLMIDNIIISTFTRIICSNKQYKDQLKGYWDFINKEFPNYKNNKYINKLDFKRRIIYYLNSRKSYFITKLIFKLKG